MSEFRATVVRVGKVEPHPNADRLELTRVFDYPVVVAKGEFREGDLAIYVSIDSVVPTEDPRWAFLQGHARIKAKRLRGIFSMGLLTNLDAEVLAKLGPGDPIGRDAAGVLGIRKYEPPEPMLLDGENERCPFEFPKYTDIEGLRRWPDLLQEREEVQITEKIHGTNFRAVWKNDRLWVGSHREVKGRDEKNALWKTALAAGLEGTLPGAPEVAFYGEVFGWVQDLRYGHSRGKASVLFYDALDLETMKYLDVDPFEELAARIGLPLVPRLFRGPWAKDRIREFSEGKTLAGADHVREGFVIRPVKERWDERVGRVILKLHGEAYMLRS